MWQLKPDIRKRSIKDLYTCIYTKKIGELTPPCLTPFAIVKYLDFTLIHIGYEPADLTVHPPPQNDRGWVHFFRIGV